MSRALGRYELVRPLARGGMAEVFLARRRAGGVEKLLVVKRIRAERANDVRFQELFKREAKLSMSLAHQNIVPVFDFGRIGDRFFLAMERVEGKDLGSSLVHRGLKEPLPPLVAAFIAAECCQALDYAHRRKNADGTSRNIVHRDVTPRNVLLSWSGEVKLTDFGIASLAGEDSSKLVGTPAYMAPEQARGEPVDVRTDVYALGMVLREALTGVRGRPGDSHDALIAAARAGTLSPWPELDLDPTLVAIVDRATAAKTGDRYAEIQEMLADLDAYIVAERAKKRGDSPAKQIAAWLARVWGEAREDSAEEVPGSAEQAPFMSFLDDDGVDAVGTGTQRSLAATAADEPAPVDEPAPKPAADSRSTAEAKPGDAKPAADAKPGDLKSAVGARPEDPKLATDAKSSSADATSSSADAARPRRGLIAVGIVAVTVLVVVLIATRGRGSRSTPDAASGSVISSLQPDAALAAHDAAVVEPDVALVDPDATAVEPDATVAAPLDARAGSGSATRAGSNAIVRVGSGSAIRAGSGSAIRAGSGSAIRAGSGSGSQGSAAPPVVATRKVHINATPWAYFTVDGGPKMQTPKLLELTPGPHRIHFENAVLKVERDITLDVPADRDISYVEPLR